MTDKLKEIIKEEVAKLPKEKQDAINSLDWGIITEEIGKRFLFDESQINDFQVQTLLILLGLADPKFYETTIEYDIGTTKDESVNIAKEVLEKIFNPIQEMIEENVKKNLPSKNPSVTHNLNFILSGGDYMAFIAPTNSPLPEYSDSRRREVDNPPRLSATPQEGNKIRTMTLQDIKSKLLIDEK